MGTRLHPGVAGLARLCIPTTGDVRTSESFTKAPPVQQARRAGCPVMELHSLTNKHC